jgi:SAM-dependent methyltransferase
MLHTDFLHALRQIELEGAFAYFPAAPCTILEIGSGTGFQARLMTERGLTVTAIDVAASAYRKERVFPVIEYDGRTIPSADAAFDVVFSSNVLEHVRDIGPLLDEMRRVMAPNAIAVHVLPTPSWRFWTIPAHYLWLMKRLCALLRSRKSGGDEDSNAPRVPATLRGKLGVFFPLRHGERGVTLSEIYFYSRSWWLKQFQAHGYKLVETRPAGLFYTSFVLGQKLSIESRRRIARVLGSACRIYVFVEASPRMRDAVCSTASQ